MNRHAPNRLASLPPILFVAAGLMLILLSSSASAASLSRVDLRELNGLRLLFLHLQNQITRTLGDEAAAAFPFVADDSHPPQNGKLSLREQERQQNRHIQCIAYWQQYRLVVDHVLAPAGRSLRITYAQMNDAYLRHRPVTITARADARARDRLVSRMSMLGYTPREIVDVITGRITLSDLRTADRMRALGYGTAQVTRYLQRRYKNVPASLQAPSLAPPITGEQRLSRARLDHYVTRYAAEYGVDPNLVRALITHESSWRPGAHSTAGAIGLMQLMPSTARMLGVNPHNPAQNIKGGVRYLAALLDMFGGDIDTALVGYNAGPSYARKWRQGKSVLYGETLEYLRRVKNSYAQQAF